MRPLKTKDNLERAVEQLLTRKVKEMGGQCFKLSSPMYNSLPDRLLVFCNKPSIYVEVKKTDGKLTTLQQKTQELLANDMKQPSFVIYGKEDVLTFIEALPAILDDLPNIVEED